MMEKWKCRICGYVYDPSRGTMALGVPPDTAWEDVPDDWRCPVCDAGKKDFAKLSPMKPIPRRASALHHRDAWT